MTLTTITPGETIKRIQIYHIDNRVLDDWHI